MADFIQRTKQDVKSKKSFSFGKKKNGKPRKDGVTVTFNDGTKTTLLTPSGKGAKYARELKENRRITNDGVVKTDENGNEIPLTKEQRAFRAGALEMQKAASKAYKAKKAKQNGGN